MRWEGRAARSSEIWMNSTRFGKIGRTPRSIGNSVAWLDDLRDRGVGHEKRRTGPARKQVGSATLATYLAFDRQKFDLIVNFLYY